MPCTHCADASAHTRCPAADTAKDVTVVAIRGDEVIFERIYQDITRRVVTRLSEVWGECGYLVLDRLDDVTKISGSKGLRVLPPETVPLWDGATLVLPVVELPLAGEVRRWPALAARRCHRSLLWLRVVVTARRCCSRSLWFSVTLSSCVNVSA